MEYLFDTVMHYTHYIHTHVARTDNMVVMRAKRHTEQELFMLCSNKTRSCGMCINTLTDLETATRIPRFI